MSTSSPEPVPTAESAPSPEAAPAPVPPAAEDVTADEQVPSEPDAPVARVVDVVDTSRVRRAPLYGRFGFAGVVVGALLSLGLTFVPVPQDQLSRGSLFLLLLIGLGTAGVLGGLAWALVLDRRSLRRRDGK